MKKGIQSYRHRANKKRTSEIDIPDKFKVMKILKLRFGIITLTDEVVSTPGGYATYRKPDLFDKQHRRAFELDGEGVHGWGDQISLRERDWRKLTDYELIKLPYYTLNSAVTQGYDEELVVSELTKQGLPPIISTPRS